MQPAKLKSSIAYRGEIVQVGGISIFKRIVRNGIIFIQFRDPDRMRSSCRGTPFVEIPLTVLCESLSMGTDWQTEEMDA